MSAFALGRYQVLVVNNSALPREDRAAGTLGVLHHAVIEPRPGARRAINSLQLGLADARAFVEGG